jgi:hypothetical protein
LKSRLDNTWGSNAYDASNPQDINEVIGNVEGDNPFYEFPFGSYQ